MNVKVFLACFVGRTMYIHFLKKNCGPANPAFLFDDGFETREHTKHDV